MGLDNEGLTGQGGRSLRWAMVQGKVRYSGTLERDVEWGVACASLRCEEFLCCSLDEPNDKTIAGCVCARKRPELDAQDVKSFKIGPVIIPAYV